MNEIDIPVDITKILPALRMIFSQDTIKVARIINSKLVQHYTSSEAEFAKI